MCEVCVCVWCVCACVRVCVCGCVVSRPRTSPPEFSQTTKTPLSRLGRGGSPSAWRAHLRACVRGSVGACGGVWASWCARSCVRSAHWSPDPRSSPDPRHPRLPTPSHPSHTPTPTPKPTHPPKSHHHHPPLPTRHQRRQHDIMHVGVCVVVCVRLRVCSPTLLRLCVCRSGGLLLIY